MKFLNQFKIYFLLILISSSTLYSQNQYNFKQFFEESGKFIEAPAKWDKNDFLRFGAILGSAFLIMQMDDDIRSEVLKDRSFYYSYPVEFARHWGEPLTTAIIAGGLSLHGLISGNRANRQLGYEIIQSFAYTAGLTAALKLSLGRARPFTGKDQFQFEPFQHVQNAYRSFPSGHTSLAFSLSTVLSARTDNKVLKILYFVPAVATAFSRVYQNHHWTSDVFVGACIGYFVGRFVTDLHDSNIPLQPNSDMVSFSFSF